MDLQAPCFPLTLITHRSLFGTNASRTHYMLLRIQREESLRSYVERNIFLNWKVSSVRQFERLSKFRLETVGVRKIASAMGWSGCFGFNRLLHHHTQYPRYSIFKNDQDIAYSQHEYLYSQYCFGSERELASFCPDCVRSDLINLGFSYWRRSHEHDLKVCAKHNVMLVKSCPFCDKPFSYQGHGLDVMWKSCGGRHLSECVSTQNKDLVELRRSQIYENVVFSKFHISEEISLKILCERVSSMKSLGDFSLDKVSMLSDRLEKALARTVRNRQDNNGHFFLNNSDLIFESLLVAYSNFDSFLNDISSHVHEFRTVETLWSTYRAGGFETAQYVNEDYVHGVGHWLCPFPSGVSSEWSSNDRSCARRPKIYACCTDREENKKAKLKAEWGKPPPPGIYSVNG